jgi:sulfur-carrier protein
VLIGDLPVASEDPASVVVRPGQTVEFLPPFAGG